jgi:hypothetical protein
MHFELAFPDHTDLPFFCKDHSARQLYQTSTEHANGAYAARRMIVVVRNMSESAARWERLFQVSKLPASASQVLPLPEDLRSVSDENRVDYAIGPERFLVTLVSAQAGSEATRRLFAAHLFDPRREGRPFHLELLTAKQEEALALLPVTDHFSARISLIYKAKEEEVAQ